MSRLAVRSRHGHIGHVAAFQDGEYSLSLHKIERIRIGVQAAVKLGWMKKQVFHRIAIGIVVEAGTQLRQPIQFAAG